jgi:hypothetical protein
MANYGMKISKDGYDVKTASVKDLVMTSKANQWKVHLQGSVTATSSSQTFTVAHGLSYTPAYIFFYKANANSYYQMSALGGANYIDGTNLSMQTASIGDKMSYIIFKDIGA